MTFPKTAAFLISRLREVAAFIRSVWVVATAFLMFLLLSFVFSNLDWQFWSERTYNAAGEITETKRDGLKLVQQLGLFLLAIIGLCLAVWRSLTAHQQAKAALEQSKTAVRQAQLVEGGQKFDRYARAAQMLDSDKQTVRQAGAYLLRELSLTDKDNYGQLCSDLLTSFIKNRNSEGISAATSKDEFEKIPTPEDVADAILCLSKASIGFEERINLKSTVWVDVEFEKEHVFRRFDFSHAFFSGSHFYNTTLGGWRTFGAKFEHLIFHQADMKKGYYTNVKFEHVDFEDVDFTGASFWDCEFASCTFKNCNLSGVKFESTSNDKKLPFDSKLLATCWIWKGKNPKLLDNDFIGAIFDPGESDNLKIEFENKWEESRMKGINFLGLNPSKKI